MPQRNLYLKNTSLQEAYDTYLERCKALVTPLVETIATETALGRVTVASVFAAISSPAYNAAAMDGIAVVAAATASAGETTPLTLAPGQGVFVHIDTGDPLLAPYDAVIMAEDVVELGESGSIQLLAAAAPWQHVRPIGEDFAQGEMIVPSSHTVRPVDIGLLLSGGIFEVEVNAQPSVGIIPTGTELVDPDSLATNEIAAALSHPGTIIDSNSRMISALVREAGGSAHREPIAADDYESLKATIKNAVAKHDMVLINAGSSAGSEDFVAPILAELGEVIIHGVAIKPGKPVILALVEGKPVIGLPGYPLATFFNFNTFAAPVLDLYTQTPRARHPKLTAKLSKRIMSSLKYREYVQVNVGAVDDHMVAVPLSRGAGVISSLARADGYLIIEQHLEGIEAGDNVEVFLYHDLLEVTHTVLAVGSHDLAMDIIADLMQRSYPHMHLRSTHVGSLAGLNALARGEAHIAPTHLLDETTGTYNIPAVRVALGSEKCALIKGLGRVQGIMVTPGNPLGIRGVEDLVGVEYINRQRGAGTRVLFDYLLKEAGIAVSNIKGYEREGTTHMAVASAIAAGSADAGMGVYSAAKTLGLDFIEVGTEEYDFAIPQRFLDLPHIQAFRDVLMSEAFHTRLDELGGYGYEHAGEIVLLEA